MKNIFLSILLSIVLFSCNDNNSSQEAPKPEEPILEYSIATVKDEANVYSLNLRSSKVNLHEGVNNVAFVTEGDTLPAGGEWKILPKMHMQMEGMTHMHSTPFLGFSDADYKSTGIGQILFVMPTVEMGEWTLEVSYLLNDEIVANWMFEIQVDAIKFLTEDPTFKTVIMTPIEGTDDRLVMGYNFTAGAPAMGSNEYEVLAFRRKPSMGHGHLETYEPLNELTITSTPYMPSMGHGSSNNTDPKHSSDGKYVGIANFTMTGDWQLMLNVSEGEQTYLDEEGQTFYFEF
ncbi:FixH family protein [Flammeovirga aprica]|uniref:YtkA-like domain-containing protein n=1 Tax=Flammeovirga aprica JL-4 TaxID=694437 RepID=A0A7X9RUK2_9BACT|nr:FixH family protein [Flammeovirga aprica]NME68986.1 hypothetical protein [Flammeovirga aprica JL-4]